MSNTNKYTTTRNKCIVKLTLGTPQVLYLKSLFPIEWTEFISEGKTYDSIEEARMKLNERLYQLSADLHEKECDVGRIEIIQYTDGKFNCTQKYIGG